MTTNSITIQHAPIQEEKGLLSWLMTVDHKRIGVMYMGTAFVYFLVAGIFALLMRVQLSRPDAKFLSNVVYNQIFTMHGTTMIFLVVMPLAVGLGNYLVPLMIGAQRYGFSQAECPQLLDLPVWRACSCTAALSLAARPMTAGSAMPR